MEDFNNKLEVLKQKLNIKTPKDILGEGYANKLILLKWLLASDTKKAVSTVKKMLNKD
jgi:hypothetical protein